ncbi:MAG: hypothetical protein ACI406_11555, partial [Victivallis vadensis]
SGVISTDSDLTFTGKTDGSGRIEISNTTGAVKYSGNADHEIYSGNYNHLTIDGTGNNMLSGDVKVNGTMSLDTSLNASGKLTLSGDTTGEGQLHSTGSVVYDGNGDQSIYNGRYDQLTVTGVGTKTLNGSIEVGNGDISSNFVNEGTITCDGLLTFTGMTTGNGRIEIANTTGAVKYSGNADHEIYSGNYNDLTIDGTGNNTLSGDVKVNGTMSLDTRLNASGSLTLSGDTTGEGQLHSTGSVVYDRNDDQDIYNGSYKDITIDGNGVKSIVGNVMISGNAVQSGAAVLHASNGNVTYNGNGTQQVMNGTYDDLTLNGTGQKLFAAGSLTTVNGTFTATGSPSQLLYLDSTIPGRQWDVAAGNLNFNWVHISNSNLLSGGADLNGNNSLGSGNTGWKVFDSAGGIGDSFPSQNNLNFSSLAMLLGNELRAAELEELFYEEGFVFRRSGSLPKLDPNGDDIAAVLQSEVDFLGLETAYDTAIFDGADFSDADYSDLMSRADIFKDEVDEALSEMVAI